MMIIVIQPKYDEILIDDNDDEYDETHHTEYSNQNSNNHQSSYYEEYEDANNIQKGKTTKFLTVFTQNSYFLHI